MSESPVRRLYADKLEQRHRASRPESCARGDEALMADAASEVTILLTLGLSICYDLTTTSGGEKNILHQ